MNLLPETEYMKCFISAVSHCAQKKDCSSPYAVLLIKVLIFEKYKIHKHTCDYEFKFTAFLKFLLGVNQGNRCRMLGRKKCFGTLI